MPFDTQAALVRAIRAWESPERPAFISLDPHLPITPDTVARHRTLLAEVDAFFPSDDEMLLPDATRDPAGVLASLDPAEPGAPRRLRFVAWKRGARGGTLYDARTKRAHDWAPRATRVEDPTGAGDAFMAGFVSAQWESDDVERALRRGIVTASFAIEAWGADGLLAATPETVRARLARLGPGEGVLVRPERLAVADEVARALAAHRGVVALETTVVTHGLPHPQGLEVATSMEARVHAAGATPATIGVLDGRVRVGLTREELSRLAASPRSRS
jgi:hypothetical protein